MRISMIAAVGNNRQLGRDNKLLWHISEDLKYFKSVTLNNPVVMGRKTFESIGRALPKRQNIVITSDKNFKADGVRVIHDPMFVFDDFLDYEEELKAVGTLKEDEDLEIFIIGGSTIYEFFLPYASTIYLTEVTYDGPADVYFPNLSEEEWEIDNISEWHKNTDGLEYRWIKLAR